MLRTRAIAGARRAGADARGSAPTAPGDPRRPQGPGRDDAAGRRPRGSRILDGFVGPYDAHIAERIEAAGGVVARQDQHGRVRHGLLHRAFAPGVPTANPWDLARVPGGSSGGSAAAVAAFHAPVSIGTDTGGSIRQPAALCGVVGMKPTYGRVSRYGIIAFASSLDQVGPLGRDVRDVAALLLTPSPAATSATRPPARCRCPDYGGHASRRRCGGELPARRQARLPARSTSWPGMEPGVEARVREAVAALSRAGCRDRGRRPAPHAITAWPPTTSSRRRRHRPTWPATTASASGTRVRDGDVLANYLATRGAGFGDEVKRRIMLGTYALSAGYYDAYYVKAQKVRTLIKGDFDAAFEHVDAIVAPTSPDRRVPPRRAARRSGRDVPVGRVHAAGQRGGPAGPVGAVRPVRGAARRPPGHRTGLGRGTRTPHRAGLRGHHRRRPAGGGWSHPSCRHSPIRPRPRPGCRPQSRRPDRRIDDVDPHPDARDRGNGDRCHRGGNHRDPLPPRKPAVSTVPPSGIRKFFDVIATMPDVISLGRGRARLHDAAARSSRPACARCAPAGPTTPATTARSSCGARWRSTCERLYGVEYDPDGELLVTVGASEAVAAAMAALVDPGDEVVLHEPSYVAYIPAVVFNGGRPVLVRDPCRPTGSHSTRRRSRRRITPRTKVLFLGYPCNPTGRGAATPATLRALADIAVRHDLLVVSDEIYDRLVYGGHRHEPIASLPGMRERTVLIGGFSKAYAMTGWRVGWLCAPRGTSSRASSRSTSTRSCPRRRRPRTPRSWPSPDAEPDVERMVAEYDRRRAALRGRAQPHRPAHRSSRAARSTPSRT